jgi:hypothetical protein
VSAFGEALSLGPVAFTDQQIADNEARILGLVELIAGGEAFAIVGAGCSVSSGFPTWGALLDRLAAVARQCSPSFRKAASNVDRLKYAQSIRASIVRARSQDYFDGELGKIFVRAPDLTPFHDDLLRLPFRGLGTTNYDPTLQAAAERQTGIRPTAVPVWNGDPRLVGRAMRALTEGKSLEYVIHFHGLCGAPGDAQPRTIILAAEDYETAYGLRLTRRADGLAAQPEPPRLRAVLSALLLMRRVVFVGFSLDDPFVNEVLLRSADLSWDWDRQIHFAILPISADDAAGVRAKAERLRQELAIETVFYETREGDHSERDKLMERIRRLVEGAGHSPPTPPPLVPPPPTRPEKAPGLDWVASANRAHQRKVDES